VKRNWRAAARTLIKRLRGGIVTAVKGASHAFARIATDTDTYIFGGTALVGLGVGAMVSVPVALIVTGGISIAFGVWMTAPRTRAASARAANPEAEG